MLIECPKCSKPNNLNLPEAKCGSCSESLSAHTYKRTKMAFGSVILAIGAGAFGMHKLDAYIHHNRYSIADEYAILDLCTNGFSGSTTSHLYSMKKDDCICALEQVQKSYSSSELVKQQTAFLTSFERSALDCRKARTSLSQSY